MIGARWQRIEQRFSALARREKLLIAAAVVIGVPLLVDAFWISPARARVKAIDAEIVRQQAEAANLQTQVAALREQLRASGDMSSVEALRKRLAQRTEQLRGLDSALVPPDRILGLLRSLLARHGGLTVMGMQTLPVVPLIETGGATRDGGNIYKHPIEIKLTGSYLELLAYVEELERGGQKVLCDSLTLSATAYPRNEMTLTVYTLSLDPNWLVL